MNSHSARSSKNLWSTSQFGFHSNTNILKHTAGGVERESLTVLLRARWTAPHQDLHHGWESSHRRETLGPVSESMRDRDSFPVIPQENIIPEFSGFCFLEHICMHDHLNNAKSMYLTFVPCIYTYTHIDMTDMHEWTIVLIYSLNYKNYKYLLLKTVLPKVFTFISGSKDLLTK